MVCIARGWDPFWVGQGSGTHNKRKETLVKASRVQFGYRSGPVRIQVGSSSDTGRAQFGYRSGPVRIQVGPSSDTGRVHFGYRSGPVRIQVGSSSDTGRAQFGYRSGPVRIQFRFPSGLSYDNSSFCAVTGNSKSGKYVSYYPKMSANLSLLIEFQEKKSF